MVAGSRFQSLRVQNFVVAVAMLGLLLAAMAAAYGMTAARQTRSPTVQINRWTTNDLRFNLPTTWRRADATRLPPDLRSITYVDTNRPTRRLTLVRVATSTPVPAAAILDHYLPVLLTAGAGATTPRVQTVEVNLYPHRQMRVFEWLGQSRATGGNPRLHLAADLLRPDGLVHYLFYLTDVVKPGEAAGDVARANIALLRSVHQSAFAMPPEHRDRDSAAGDRAIRR